MPDRHSSSTGLRDFDFLYGQWLVRNRRLRRPLSGSTAWDEFDAWYKCWPLLEGVGNVDEMHPDDGGPSRASLRFLDPQGRRWNVYRLCSRTGALQPPLAGAFRSGVGRFYGERRIEGRPIAIRHTWTASTDWPRWERAWSADGGSTWEDNWVMDFTRIDWPLEIGQVDRRSNSAASAGVPGISVEDSLGVCIL